MKTKQENTRRLLLVLPILVIPFLALAFYALGGGKGTDQEDRQTDRKGINTDLPVAHFKEKDEPINKLGFYEQSEKDSVRHDKENTEQLASHIELQETAVPQADEIGRKLKQLEKEINRPAETPVTTKSATTNRQPISMGKDVDRLEALMHSLQEGKIEDPEMEQLNDMLDKILSIQNPITTQVKTNPQNEASADNSFKAIPAVIADDQRAVQGATIKLRFSDSTTLNGNMIPKGYFISGTCRIVNQRLLIDVKNIRIGTSIIPVDLTVYSLDGMPGIDAPEAMLSDAINSGTENALQNIDLTMIDQRLATQVAGAGLGAAKSMLSKRIRRIKVKLKAGQPVLLRNNAIKQSGNRTPSLNY